MAFWNRLFIYRREKAPFRYARKHKKHLKTCPKLLPFQTVYAHAFLAPRPPFRTFRVSVTTPQAQSTAGKRQALFRQ
jgi:hypothetical protein